MTVGTVRTTQKATSPQPRHTKRLFRSPSMCQGRNCKWQNLRELSYTNLAKRSHGTFSKQEPFLKWYGCLQGRTDQKTLLFKAAQSTMFSWNIELCVSCRRGHHSWEKPKNPKPNIDHKTSNHWFNICQGARKWKKNENEMQLLLTWGDSAFLWRGHSSAPKDVSSRIVS